jgi:transcription termination factor NusB
MTLQRALWTSIFTLASAACSAGTQKPAIETAMKTDEQRAESLEATLRVMDENPEYVDELFALVVRHPATLERFLENHARNLKDDELAKTTAKHLAAHPPGLKHVMVKTLDEISDDPAAMQAVAEAMLERPQVSAMVIAQKPEAVRALVTALIAEVRKNDKAREAFIQALHDNRDPVADLALANPELLTSLMKAFAARGAARGKAALEEAVE